jgi:hypothetical protein
MKKLLMATVLVAIVMLSGCLSALHPLFREQDLEFDPKLVGSWRVGADDEVFTFERGTPESFGDLPEGLQELAGKAYVLTVTNGKGGEENVKYYAFLARIGKHLYLDYYPAETKAQRAHAGFFKANFVKMHSFYRLQPGKDGNTITIGQFADSYLHKLINNKQIRIRHELNADGSYIITAPTEELQQYVIKYSDVSEAYQNNKTYTRIQ